MDEKRKELFTVEDSEQPDRDQFTEFVGPFNSAQKEIDAGFPLEAGIKTKSALDSLSKLDSDSFVGPEGMVLDPLEIILDGFETEQDASTKDELHLNEEELQREAEMVDFYPSNEKYWIALEIGRELFINRLLYDSGETENWLDRDTREDVISSDGEDNDDKTSVNSDVERLWDQISGARNNYAHAGFKKDQTPSEDKIESALEELCEQIDHDAFWQP